MIGTPVVAQAQNSEYVQGKTQGQANGKADAKRIWFIAGLGLGPIGWGAAALTTPSIPADKMMGKSQDYTLGYADGYKAERKKKQSKYAAVGMVGWVIVYTVAFSPLLDGSTY